MARRLDEDEFDEFEDPPHWVEDLCDLIALFLIIFIVVSVVLTTLR